MAYQFMKVLINVKYQYFSFVNVVTIPSIDSNNLKLLYLSFYEIYNKPEIETHWGRRDIETNMQSQSQAFGSTKTSQCVQEKIN